MLSPALFVMYTRTVSADAGNAANASKNHRCLKPIREPIELLELIAVLLYRTRRASLGVGVLMGQGAQPLSAFLRPHLSGRHFVAVRRPSTHELHDQVARAVPFDEVAALR